MLRQILSQIWYYRRSSLWLLCELVVIFITSWFLADNDTYEASAAALARFGQTILQMPEVSACAVTGMSLPGLGTYTANMVSHGHCRSVY